MILELLSFMFLINYVGEDLDFMGAYRVCLNTIVRMGEEMDSEKLRILPKGSRVNVTHRKGRRVRIDSPVIGWCSVIARNGDTILTKIVVNSYH